ncbi:hypothetical protein B6R96_36480 (plasmid) [Streptomyces sp. Sge12]|nr:hypothetical protein B6R96_36480 [Streptomyces sp. Sge12]
MCCVVRRGGGRGARRRHCPGNGRTPPGRSRSAHTARARGVRGRGCRRRVTATPCARFVFAAVAEVEREFIYERTLAGLDTGAAIGKHGGRPLAVDGDMLAVALRRRDAKESVTAIAGQLGVGRSTLYRTFAAHDEAIATGREPAG